MSLCWFLSFSLVLQRRLNLESLGKFLYFVMNNLCITIGKSQLYKSFFWCSDTHFLLLQNLTTSPNEIHIDWRVHSKRFFQPLWLKMQKLSLILQRQWSLSSPTACIQLSATAITQSGCVLRTFLREDRCASRHEEKITSVALGKARVIN